MDKLKVFIGFDPAEEIAWEVARFSLLRHATIPVEIYKLRQTSLRELGLYWRAHDAGASTEFSLTRFLTPYLASYEGWALFVDCDFLFTKDIRNIEEVLDQNKAIHVVKHDYEPSKKIKMDGTPQSNYPRKNWSSFMMFNCRHPKVRTLDPTTVNTKSPSFLHRFEWLEDEEIGNLPISWNFLEGEYPKPEAVPAAIHFTNGGPWFSQWQNVDFADLWTSERTLMQNRLPSS
jgi:hypothetical protein